MRLALAILLAGCLAAPAQSQYAPVTPTVAAIWPNGAPGSEARRTEPEVAKDYWVANVHNPSLTMYRPTRQNGAALIVIPGGAHKQIVWTTEGVNVGPALNRYGLTVFVLKYRLAREAGSRYTIDDAAADVHTLGRPHDLPVRAAGNDDQRGSILAGRSIDRQRRVVHVGDPIVFRNLWLSTSGLRSGRAVRPNCSDRWRNWCILRLRGGSEANRDQKS